MSSPLTMLKKTKRPPLQGSLKDPRCRQNVTFRKDSSASDFQSDDPQVPQVPRSRESSISSPTSPPRDASPTDFELMSVMMQQMILLEKRARSQEEELRHKDRQIVHLEGKLKIWEKTEAAREETCKHDLEQKCQRLQDQVNEMENLLSECGLVWMEGSGDSDSGAVEIKDFSLDFDLVLERVKELNVLAGEEQIFIQPTSTGAQLRRVDPVPLRLYSNGIVMSDGPFRSFQDPSAQWCMLDIMEGYFPSELQEQFPDGVPFEVHDCRDQEFNLDPLWLRFPGDGQTILGERFESTKPVCCHLGRKSNILPKVVIRAGEVMDVRDLGVHEASNDSQVVVETAALQSMRERLQTSDLEPPALGGVTVKVRSEGGERSYLLKMDVSETVGDVRRYLDRHRGDRVENYDIISVSPLRCYHDSWTLQSCGLTCNFSLILRRKMEAKQNLL